MTALWRFLCGIPALAYAFAGGVALVAALTTWHARTVEAAYQRGRSDVLQAAHFDSTLRAVVDSGRTKAAAKTDTVIRTVTRHAVRVESLTVRVPDSIRVLVPVVDTLVIESQALVRAVDSLTGALATERAATKVSLDVRDGLIRDARLENARQAALILALEKRPTRAQAALFSVCSAAAGAACGRWC